MLRRIHATDSAFIILIPKRINQIPVKMNSKEILLKELFEKVGDALDEETVSEKVSQFIKHGNLFLLFEVMSLRKEMEKIKEDIKSTIDTLEDKNLSMAPKQLGPIDP